MKFQVFNSVLSQINNKDIRLFTVECLKDAPDFLETVPASVSGKYHPPEACEKGGLCWHVLAACHYATIFFKAFKWETNEIRADIILSALLLHDIGKQESYSGKFWAYKNHPLTAGKMISRYKDLLPEKAFNLIHSCVIHHMGPWTPPNIIKAINRYNICELIVYQSDYLSSQKKLKIL